MYLYRAQLHRSCRVLHGRGESSQSDGRGRDAVCGGLVCPETRDDEAQRAGCDHARREVRRHAEDQPKEGPRARLQKRRETVLFCRSQRKLRSPGRDRRRHAGGQVLATQAGEGEQAARLDDRGGLRRLRLPNKRRQVLSRKGGPHPLQRRCGVDCAELHSLTGGEAKVSWRPCHLGQNAPLRRDLYSWI